MMKQLQARVRGGSAASEKERLKTIIDRESSNPKQQIRRLDEGNHRQFNSNSILDFPQFDGNIARIWIKNVSKGDSTICNGGDWRN
ncbi:unnamed protein product [Cuscuta campestris]|uniref:Uncharacterized protein n=1 Tax=Cuscuta campestris TaxID=132261 RepID=A0A484K6E8_9ASTE|nr:unnamed protein product [Cuscuta campestris]